MFRLNRLAIQIQYRTANGRSPAVLAAFAIPGASIATIAALSASSTRNGLDHLIGPGTHHGNVIQLHIGHALVQPFDTTFHRLHKREPVIRQAGGRDNTGKTAATADIGNRLELLLSRGFLYERHNGGRIQNMAFPNNANISWPNQTARFAFFGKFRMENTKLAQRIPQHFLKHRRIIKFVCHITHGHHPISCSSSLPVFQQVLPDH